MGPLLTKAGYTVLLSPAPAPSLLCRTPFVRADSLKSFGSTDGLNTAARLVAGPCRWNLEELLFVVRREPIMKPHRTSLPSLHLDCVEAICERLELRDRVCLTSCCAVLWARPDITGSFALWGDVDTWATRKSRELANWLLRRRAGLRRLRLDFTSLPCDPAAPALKALCAAAWLTELTLLSVRDASPTTWAALTMLPRLSRLEVRYSCLRSVPAGLPPSLVSLGLSGNKQLGEEGAAAFDALERLPGITRLDLSSCGLRALPPQLESTTALAELRLSGNPLLGEASGAAFQPLRALDSLTRLDFWACSLRSVPWQLSGLTGLVDLSLAGSKLGGREAEGAFLALGELAGLRRLDMSHCGLAALPPQLGLLGGLQRLEVSFNEGFREGGSEAFDVLQELVALTRLGLRMCALHRMPWQLSLLRDLRELDASFNWALGKERAAAFAPLERLRALSRLDLSSSCVGSLPSQLSHLANSLS